jgi:hypothetical protein
MPGKTEDNQSPGAPRAANTTVKNIFEYPRMLKSLLYK